MSTIIFGRGFLGHKLAQTLPGAILSDADITREDAVREALATHRPTAIVNAAGKTGRPNVDWCETHQSETHRSNVEGPLLLARVAAEANVYLVHLASGCIFYGPSPDPSGWREDDFANPSSFYSRTKYAADLVLSRLPNVGVARLRMPIDGVPGPRNLITKLASYAQVVDVENSVTIVDDLVNVVKGLIQRRATGVFHATNPGKMRHRDLLALYREYVDPSHTCALIGESELLSRGLVAHARSNCILSSARLDALGLTMRPVDEALQDTMKQYARARKLELATAAISRSHTAR